MSATMIVLGAQGRVVLPAAARAALGLTPGDQLSARVAGNAIILQRPEDAVTELRRLGRDVQRDRSLVDELLSERRAEAEAQG